jgi:hypothetical protein
MEDRMIKVGILGSIPIGWAMFSGHGGLALILMAATIAVQCFVAATYRPY